MPFYRYVCQSCGEDFRVLQAADPKDSAKCPECGSQEVERQLPRVAVQFKGSGYYKTDRDPKRSKAGTKSKQQTSTDATTGSSSDTPSKSDPGGSESSTPKKDSPKKSDD